MTQIEATTANHAERSRRSEVIWGLSDTEMKAMIANLAGVLPQRGCEQMCTGCHAASIPWVVTADWKDVEKIVSSLGHNAERLGTAVQNLHPGAYVETFRDSDPAQLTFKDGQGIADFCKLIMDETGKKSKIMTSGVRWVDEEGSSVRLNLHDLDQLEKAAKYSGRMSVSISVETTAYRKLGKNKDAKVLAKTFEAMIRGSEPLSREDKPQLFMDLMFFSPDGDDQMTQETIDLLELTLSNIDEELLPLEQKNKLLGFIKQGVDGNKNSKWLLDGDFDNIGVRVSPHLNIGRAEKTHKGQELETANVSDWLSVLDGDPEDTIALNGEKFKRGSLKSDLKYRHAFLEKVISAAKGGFLKEEADISGNWFSFFRSEIDVSSAIDLSALNNKRKKLITKAPGSDLPPGVNLLISDIVGGDLQIVIPFSRISINEVIDEESTKELGKNPTGLSIAELKSLPGRPDLYEKDLTHGMNSQVYLLNGGKYVVKIANPERLDNSLQLDFYEIAQGMWSVKGHPNIENALYAFSDGEADILVTEFIPGITELYNLPNKKEIISNPRFWQQIIEACAFMDGQGVLQKDMCEWDILVSKEGIPHILDFDKLRLIDWTNPSNLSMEQLALGFERDNSTLRPEYLNIDDVQENFLMELAVFYLELEKKDFWGGYELFKNFLITQRDSYCDVLIAAFEMHDDVLINSINKRKERLNYWLSSPTRTYTLYLRKRMHFLMRAINWGSSVIEESDYQLDGFLGTVYPLLVREINRRSYDGEHHNIMYTGREVYVDKNSIEQDGQQGSELSPERTESLDMTMNRIILDLEEDLPDSIKNRLQLAVFGDVHGRLGPLSKIGQIIRKLREEDFVSAVWSMGDNVEGGSIAGNLMATIEMMEAMGVAVSLIGNHEIDYHDLDYAESGLSRLRTEVTRLLSGISSEKEDISKALEMMKKQVDSVFEKESILAKAIEKAQFPFMCGNMNYGGKFKELFESQDIIPAFMTEIDGNPVLVIGVLSPDVQHEIKYHKSRGFNDELELDQGIDAINALIRKTIESVREKNPDLNFSTILLSHAGLNHDQVIAEQNPDISMIIGSHTHNIAHKVVAFPELGRKTHIVHFGQNGLSMGLIQPVFDDEGKISSVNPILIDVSRSSGFTGDSDFEGIIERVDYLDSKTIAKVIDDTFSIEGKSTRSTPLMRLVVDSVKNQLPNVDISVNFGGNVRDSLPKGDITVSDIERILPWENKVFIVSLRGEDIRLLITKAISNSRNDSSSRSLLLHFSGLYYEIGQEGELTDVWLDKDKTVKMDNSVYRVAVPDFMYKGMGADFPIDQYALDYENVDRTVRELVAAEIEERRVLEDNPHDNQRIVISDKAPLKYNDPVIIY